MALSGCPARVQACGVGLNESQTQLRQHAERNKRRASFSAAGNHSRQHPTLLLHPSAAALHGTAQHSKVQRPAPRTHITRRLGRGHGSTRHAKLLVRVSGGWRWCEWCEGQGRSANKDCGLEIWGSMDKRSSGGAVRVIVWRWRAVVHHVNQKQTGQGTGWSRAGVWKWPGVRSSEETGFHWALIESMRPPAS